MTTTRDEQRDVVDVAERLRRKAWDYADDNPTGVLMGDAVAEILRLRSELSARSAPVAEGWRLVPETAIEWLMGNGPDTDGNHFGADEGESGRFWWRSKFRAMLSAAPLPPSPGAEIAQSDEITRLRAELVEAKAVIALVTGTILSDSAAQVDRARPTDDRDGTWWNGPGEDWWESFTGTVGNQIEAALSKASDTKGGTDT